MNAIQYITCKHRSGYFLLPLYSSRHPWPVCSVSRHMSEERKRVALFLDLPGCWFFNARKKKKGKQQLRQKLSRFPPPVAPSACTEFTVRKNEKNQKYVDVQRKK